MGHTSGLRDEDILASYQCGCYIRRGAKSAPSWYFVRCSLHAAAPDLLAACKAALEMAEHLESTFGAIHGDLGLVIETLQEAIAKGKGE